MAKHCRAHYFRAHSAQDSRATPNLVISSPPLRLNAELVLDQLTDDEVTRCCQVDVLRPHSPQFQIIFAETAIGIRRTVLVAKIIEAGDAITKLPSIQDGSFGNRPLLQ